jgi:hypothetical protein
MKKSSFILMIAGVAIIIVGSFVFRNLSYINAADAHKWSININGIKSFPWVTFSGGVLLVIGIIFNISSRKQKGRRFE